MSNKDSKIINFPTHKNQALSDNELVNEFESWEQDAEYFYSKDWNSLVRYRMEACNRKPDDIDLQVKLGEAYTLNKEYERAIDVLTKILQSNPENIDAQHYLLDVLFAIEKDENSFDWVEKPTVLRISDNVTDQCHKYLKSRKKPTNVVDLFCNVILSTGCYIKFNEEELLELLLDDCRFSVEGDINYYHECDVSVKTKKRER